MPQFREDERHAAVWAAKTPDRPAIIDARDGSVMTFAQFEALSNRAAHLARSAGLAVGEVAAVFMENRPDYVPLVWGLLRAGLRVTAIPTHLTPDEIDYILADSGARLLLTSAAKAEVAERLTAAPEARFMADAPAPGYADLDAALAARPSTRIRDEAEGVEMLYSSGTTGRPKGVKKPLPDLPFGTPPPAYQRGAERFGLDESVVYLHPAPLYHAAPLGYALRVNRYGGTLIATPRFDAEQSLQLIEKYRVTHSQWVPTHFIRMLRLPDEVRAKYDVSSMKCAIHAAAPCPVEVKRAMIDWWGPVIEEYYAGSEGNGLTAISSEEWLRKPGSVGRAIVGRIRICDDQGEELPPDTEGVIHFSDAPVFEYHNDPQKTAESRNRHGWSTLGDVGYVDEDGYLFLTDRKSFMIVSGGVNIYPAEVENLLVTHPAVLDAAVIGVPEPEFGEEVKAVVELAEGHARSDALAEDILAFCRERLSHVKCPKSVDFTDQLPRADNGKLYKRQLRDAYWQKAEAGT
ncbi:MAG: acyl-CoA synthetase [Pseudomonadota bacterium]